MAGDGARGRGGARDEATVHASDRTLNSGTPVVLVRSLVPFQPNQTVVQPYFPLPHM